MEITGTSLVDACYEENWEKAKAMIAKNPWLVCTAKNKYGDTPKYFAFLRNNVDFLQYMADAILLLSLDQPPQEQQQQRRQMLRNTFETGSAHGFLVNLASSHVRCFLLEHAPSGVAILQVKGLSGWTSAHHAAAAGRVSALDFIVRNAPSGAEVLKVKNNFKMTPFEMAMQNGKVRALEYINRTQNRILPASSTSKIQEHTGLCGYP
jgi:ankyrin repeat protein